jgi:predicted amidophosphoribosyltransferase
VATRTGCKVAQVLRRLRPTLPQGDPRVTSREQNVASAFAMARPGAVRGRAVVLLDDVLTSGATARACARLLLGSGAEAVAAITACRA